MPKRGDDDERRPATPPAAATEAGDHGDVTDVGDHRELIARIDEDAAALAEVARLDEVLGFTSLDDGQPDDLDARVSSAGGASRPARTTQKKGFRKAESPVPTGAFNIAAHRAATGDEVTSAGRPSLADAPGAADDKTDGAGIPAVLVEQGLMAEDADPQAGAGDTHTDSRRNLELERRVEAIKAQAGSTPRPDAGPAGRRRPATTDRHRTRSPDPPEHPPARRPTPSARTGTPRRVTRPQRGPNVRAAEHPTSAPPEQPRGPGRPRVRSRGLKPVDRSGAPSASTGAGGLGGHPERTGAAGRHAVAGERRERTGQRVAVQRVCSENASRKRGDGRPPESKPSPAAGRVATDPARPTVESAGRQPAVDTADLTLQVDTSAVKQVDDLVSVSLSGTGPVAAAPDEAPRLSAPSEAGGVAPADPGPGSVDVDIRGGAKPRVGAAPDAIIGGQRGGVAGTRTMTGVARPRVSRSSGGVLRGVSILVTLLLFTALALPSALGPPWQMLGRPGSVSFVALAFLVLVGVVAWLPAGGRVRSILAVLVGLAMSAFGLILAQSAASADLFDGQPGVTAAFGGPIGGRIVLLTAILAMPFALFWNSLDRRSLRPRVAFLGALMLAMVVYAALHVTGIGEAPTVAALIDAGRTAPFLGDRLASWAALAPLVVILVSLSVLVPTTGPGFARTLAIAGWAAVIAPLVIAALFVARSDSWELVLEPLKVVTFLAAATIYLPAALASLVSD